MYGDAHVFRNGACAAHVFRNGACAALKEFSCDRI